MVNLKWIKKNKLQASLLTKKVSILFIGKIMTLDCASLACDSLCVVTFHGNEPLSVYISFHRLVSLEIQLTLHSWHVITSSSLSFIGRID